MAEGDAEDDASEADDEADDNIDIAIQISPGQTTKVHERQMIRRQLHRPSLKITRNPDQGRVRSFTFEVWSPFTGNYQIAESMDAAMARVDWLAGLIRQMWLQRHPKQDTLVDTPGPAGDGTGEWAEFRINATTYRSYDTRRHDRPGWTRAMSLNQAAETTCIRVGCTPPRPNS